MDHVFSTVFISSEAELISTILSFTSLGTIMSGLALYYKHSRCHEPNCKNRLGLRRHGRYPQGHLKLCHVHHPRVKEGR